MIDPAIDTEARVSPTFPMGFLKALERVRRSGNCNMYDRRRVFERLDVPNRWILKLFCPTGEDYVRALQEMHNFVFVPPVTPQGNYPRGAARKVKVGKRR